MANISKTLKRAMETEALARYPQEACGLIVKKKRTQTLIPCRNISDDPEHRFVIAPEAFAWAEDLGEVMAIWHSHTDEPSTPSETDIHACNSLELTWFISSVSKSGNELVFGDITTLVPTATELDLIGRPYVYGIYDCYTLMLDYYKKELGIDLDRSGKHYPERPDWHTEGLNLLVEGFRDKGFTRVTDDDYQIGDVLIIQLSSATPNHLAVYIGDDKILHHCSNRLSCVDLYGGSYWQKHTSHHLRYRGDQTC